MSEVLRIEGLRFAWPRSPWILDVPSLVLEAGDRVFLHGPSGTGKSTLLNLIAGTLLPQAGAVRVAGEDVAKRSGPARDRLRADHLGIVFQQFNLLPFLSMVDNVTLPCRFSKRRRERALRVVVRRCRVEVDQEGCEQHRGDGEDEEFGFLDDF